MIGSSYTFLPWARRGLARAVDLQDDPRTALPSRAEVPVTVRLNDNAAAEATVKVRLFGPGDVTGFDPRAITRVEPAALSRDFETNYFPAVEFDRPDFPWLFTPASPNASGQLRPWICLVAVEKREGVELLPPCGGQPLAVLRVDDAQAELPDLAESWGWAHVQINGPEGDVGDILANRPELALSRLVCPRELKPRTTYYACVVPVFEVGRKAGLGLPVSYDDPADQTLKPAWDGATGSLDLPVYYHWEFSTGEGGDFESLVGLLQRKGLPESVGRRDMSVAQPGGGLSALTGAVGLEGALDQARPQASPDSPESGRAPIPEEFKEALRTLLNAGARPEATASGPLPGGSPSTVAAMAPLYGRWHAAQRGIPDGQRDRPWLRELNLDPRERAAAGFGALVVQKRQDQLMASAWEQVEEIERVNQALRQAQLARSAGTAAYQGHFVTASNETLFVLTAPAHPRLVFRDATTIRAEAKDTRLPTAALSAAFRRLARPRGPIARRVARSPVGQAAGSAREYWPGSLVRRLGSGDIDPAPDHQSWDDVGTADEGKLEHLLDEFRSDAQPTAFEQAAILHLERMPEHPGEATRRRRLDLGTLTGAILEGLDPEITVPKRWRPRIETPEGWNPEDPLEPVMAAPRFPTPMYRALAELSPELLLPGISAVPPNTLAAVRTNSRFIEAFMVGLNHEMSRELLWREYPTDQRGTYFRRFWNRQGRLPGSGATMTAGGNSATAAGDSEALDDVPPLDTWTERLGGNIDDGPTDVVLLVRGDLLRRYPQAVIYAARARWVEDRDSEGKVVTVDGRVRRHREPIPLPDDWPPQSGPALADPPEKYPIFQGTLPPDITFFGFDLDPAEAAGDQDPAQDKPGWFFVVQQPPAEPRFGLDAAEGETRESWADLAWPLVPKTTSGYARPQALTGFPDPGQPPNVHWGPEANSAALAFITLQRPVRIAIHASDLVTG